jgi:hypothetical protein
LKDERSLPNQVNMLSIENRHKYENTLTCHILAGDLTFTPQQKLAYQSRGDLNGQNKDFAYRPNDYSWNAFPSMDNGMVDGLLDMDIDDMFSFTSVPFEQGLGDNFFNF